MFRGGFVVLAGGLVCLAIAAAPALATTDRLDYSDQANPICKSSNKQIDDFYEATEAEIDRLYDVRAKNRKQARRLSKRRDQLEEQLPFQILAMYQAELNGLKAIAAPPGYEPTVAAWLSNRQQIADLYQQYVQIEKQLENPFGTFHKKPSRKALRRRSHRPQKLFTRSDQIVDQLLADEDIDLELGTRMGAAYCVTGATGDLAIDIASPDDE